MALTEKFPGPWEIRKLLDGYKVIAADGRCLSVFSVGSNSALSVDDAFILAVAFADLGNPPSASRETPRKGDDKRLTGRRPSKR